MAGSSVALPTSLCHPSPPPLPTAPLAPHVTALLPAPPAHVDHEAALFELQQAAIADAAVARAQAEGPAMQMPPVPTAAAAGLAAEAAAARARAARAAAEGPLIGLPPPPAPPRL